MSKPSNTNWDEENLNELEDKALAGLRQPVTMFEPPDVLAEVHRRIAEPARPRKMPIIAWAACGLVLVFAGTLVPSFTGQPDKPEEIAIAPAKPPAAATYTRPKTVPPAKKTSVPVKKIKATPKAKPAPEPTRYWPRNMRHIARNTTPKPPAPPAVQPKPSYMIVCTPEPMVGFDFPDTASTLDTDTASLPDNVPMDSYDIRMTDTETGAVTSLSVTNVINSDGTESSLVDYSVTRPASDPGTLPTDRSYFDENSYPDYFGAALRSSG